MLSNELGGAGRAQCRHPSKLVLIMIQVFILQCAVKDSAPSCCILIYSFSFQSPALYNLDHITYDLGIHILGGNRLFTLFGNQNRHHLASPRLKPIHNT